MNTSKTPLLPVLIVDDEMETLQGCEFTLNSGGINHIVTCLDSREVIPLLKQQEFSVVVLDLSMPYISGHDLLKHLCTEYPHIPVIILTGMNEVDSAVSCMKTGAFDYMVKPVEESRMISGVRRAVELREERREYGTFRRKILDDTLEHPEAFSKIITCSKTMRSIFQYVETIAVTGKSILITGESGVGKELIARAVHPLSGRKGRLVAINVAGLDDNLFSDTLFGHFKGAFTHAVDTREGLVARAKGGTLFLDEIGDLNESNQLKLLRLLQENEYYPVGSDVPREADVRIIAATNRDLNQLQQAGRFRSDLYYRLQPHHVHIPPLRDRLGDLPLLTDHFIEQAAVDLNKAKPTPPRELYAFLAGYDFPGNIRELQAMIFDAVSHHKSKMLSMERFKFHVLKHGGSAQQHRKKDSGASNASPFALFETLPTLKEIPGLLITEALQRSRGSKDAAAQILGITRSGLNKAIRRSGRAF